MEGEEDEPLTGNAFTPTIVPSGDGGSWADPSGEPEGGSGFNKKGSKLIVNMDRIKAAVNGSMVASIALVISNTGKKRLWPEKTWRRARIIL